ncbi:response regulator transcription factor [Actinoplanes bogorensis]|uniref:Response regulator transcription factor n=1 Tax=Paractinoplanes bogorensis TaxID=1610840 RepID=A0ABS5YNL1_9ACTN|nr:response regulator transcription factor [Actinoplanes bogorensis]MBU2665051.1 response regulator transcription factor [Actinoplanes bogorensis]
MIRILIAEDMPIIRKALVALLALEPGLQVVADVGRGDEIMPAALDVRPGIALLDIDLPGISGLDAAEELHRHLPDCKIIILTGLGRPGNLLRALSAHVRGFVVKDAPVETLVDGIRRVAAGGRVVDPDLVAAALDTGASPLTTREADVLRIAGDGHSTVQIGRMLSLSPATVRNYLSNAIAKTGARNRIGAIRAAERAGWI